MRWGSYFLKFLVQFRKVTFLSLELFILKKLNIGERILMRSIASIYKGRDLPDILREIYISGIQLYVFLENSDNPLNLFCSAFWLLPRSMVWELGHTVDYMDDYSIQLKILHPIETIEFGPNRKFIPLEILKERDGQKFLSDDFQSLLLKFPDGCQLVRRGRILPVEDLIRFGGLQPEEAYARYESELLKNFIDPLRQVKNSYIVTTVTVSAEKLFIAGNPPPFLLGYSIRFFCTVEQDHPDWKTWGSGKKRLNDLAKKLYPELNDEQRKIVIAATTQCELRTSG